MARTHLIAAPCVASVAFLFALCAVEARSQVTNVDNGAAARVSSSSLAARAVAALDAISAKEWLTQSSRALLARVIAASSKAELDEAAKTDPRAQTLVGAGFTFGVSGYPQSDADAEKYYRPAARTNAIAQLNLGVMIENGRASSGSQPALQVAIILYKRAAEQGHAIAQTNLGMHYQKGLGVAQDDKEAARWFASAASQGYAEAQYQLGDLYYNGRGVGEDEAKAVSLFQSAADQGHADALDLLAMQAVKKGWAKGKFDNDENTNALFAKAFKAYQRDAAAGSAHALYMIGFYFRLGNGVAKDPKAAYTNFKKAADAGDLEGLQSIGVLTENGEGVTKDEAAALRLYRQCAERGRLTCQTLIARMIEKGRGGFKADKAEAIRLYKELAQKGDAEAYFDLKRLGEIK
jgi:TPR repeat protein